MWQGCDPNGRTRRARLAGKILIICLIKFFVLRHVGQKYRQVNNITQRRPQAFHGRFDAKGQSINKNEKIAP